MDNVVQVMHCTTAPMPRTGMGALLFYQEKTKQQFMATCCSEWVGELNKFITHDKI